MTAQYERFKWARISACVCGAGLGMAAWCFISAAHYYGTPWMWGYTFFGIANAAIATFNAFNAAALEAERLCMVSVGVRARFYDLPRVNP